MYEPYILYEESISPKEFIQMSPKETANIKSSEIVPPKLGQNDFGKIKITYKNPKYITSF